MQCRGHSEKLRFITKELEETKANLACHEDKHTVLKKRIDRLEKDNTILMEEIEDRRKEVYPLINEFIWVGNLGSQSFSCQSIHYENIHVVGLIFFRLLCRMWDSWQS